LFRFNGIYSRALDEFSQTIELAPMVTGQWVRSDVVEERGDCETVPGMAG
jgi:hypothetical protein